MKLSVRSFEILPLFFDAKISVLKETIRNDIMAELNHLLVTKIANERFWDLCPYISIVIFHHLIAKSPIKSC